VSGAATVIALLCAVGGLLLLRASWRRRGGGWRLALGWLLLAAGALAWRLTGAGWDKAVALAALTGGLAALPLLAWTADWPRPSAKSQRPRDAAAPAPASSSSIWRGVARALLAGPVACAAALGLAAALALRAPMDDADRLVAAGFLLPLAWALGAVWATTDGRLVRIALGLAGLAAAGFGLAVT
jgi:hypothetical protein